MSKGLVLYYQQDSIWEICICNPSQRPAIPTSQNCRRRAFFNIAKNFILRTSFRMPFPDKTRNIAIDIVTFDNNTTKPVDKLYPIPDTYNRDGSSQQYN